MPTRRVPGVFAYRLPQASRFQPLLPEHRVLHVTCSPNLAASMVALCLLTQWGSGYGYRISVETE